MEEQTDLPEEDLDMSDIHPEYFKQYYFYRDNGENKKFRIKKILYLKADDNYVCVYFRDGTSVMIRSPLEKIMYGLPVGRFMKISRKYAVACKRVTAWTKDYMKLGEIELPIMKSYLPIIEFKFVVLSGN